MKNENKSSGWKFINDDSTFSISNPQKSSYLYFPLVNEAGMMSAITPTLHGDIKTSQNTFLMAPVSSEDLHNSRAARNFWVHIEGEDIWSATGNSAKQISLNFKEKEEEEVHLEAGLLWHKVTRENKKLGIKAECTSFVPANKDQVELLKVNLSNTSDQDLTVTPTAAIPLYARSADDIRDHRHVTSLLHRIYTSKYGIEVQPTLSFDERGHKINHVTYSVLGSDGNGEAPTGFFPVVEDFIGEGGNLDWPKVIVKNEAPHTNAGETIEGYEAIGALKFNTTTLKPGESKSYIVVLMITDNRPKDISEISKKYCSEEQFDLLLEQNKIDWKDKLNNLNFETSDIDFNQWMKWVTLQPILRRIYGCSFLPHHDYGKGGRGWRDLWQDCLALLIMDDPKKVKELLLNNFAGVRIDGSNATIIGSEPGEFVADRNNISRVWMDHGAWPFLTTMLYIHQSGDIEFLLENQTYFKDTQIKRSKDLDLQWDPEQGNQLKSENSDIYEGTIFEHMLLQNIVQFYNVGQHNNIKLEGADWNDAFDLAPDLGESVAFTALYASNLKEMSQLLLSLQKKTGTEELQLTKEIIILLDTISNPINYDNVEEKLERLNQYFETCSHKISGEKTSICIKDLAADLNSKADWMINHLRQNEWIKNEEGFEWFNGYYNNDAERVEGDHTNGVRMTLTGQVFPVMGGVATDDQVKKISESVTNYLKDEKIGYRLNSQFGEIQQNIGRGFGFAFGHKENGAMFSHMAVMYSNAMYQRQFGHEGYDVINSIYELSKNFELSRIYPGVPEYISEKGRGMYHYLTGSASWLLLTVLTEMFGVKGNLGDLSLEPKLLINQFNDQNVASVFSYFANRHLNIVYKNENGLDHGAYQIQSITLNGEEITFETKQKAVIISREFINQLPENENHTLEVVLG
ncbi:GH36-type glycosyl hydrolase domain-containing protein [Chengkuizengella sediminis]|uniref:GH36-type glycosyl hydrolase domain-containing protein n=1 Tax=Chengkuizengella sediminis TaxID=1885917 RepID=UPI0013894EA9|nr:cellobiose phosphorylase [Chengkuizengella sediminis]NDI35872.1 cellobiose phosphorylase [Chengkuizengella sediminis]